MITCCTMQYICIYCLVGTHSISSSYFGTRCRRCDIISLWRHCLTDYLTTLPPLIIIYIICVYLSIQVSLLHTSWAYQTKVLPTTLVTHPSICQQQIPPEMYPSYYIYVQMYSSIYGLWVNIESAMNLSIGNHIFKVDNKLEAWHCVNSLSMTFIYLLPLNEQFNIYICVYRSETTPTIFMRFRKQGVSGRSMIHY